MKKILLALSLIISYSVSAQDNLKYQKPTQEILDLVDVSLAPGVLMDESKENMILLYRDAFKSIAVLSQEELRLGGLRIDPKTNIGSRTTYYKNLKIRKVNSNSDPIQVKGLPSDARIANLSWSPDQKRMAFTNTTNKGVEAWVMEVEGGVAKKLTDATVNANLRDVINWFEDSKSFLVKMVSPERKQLINTKEAIPEGPTVSENDGKKAQNRTYQDLLKNPNDEFNFEQLALSELYKVNIDGKKESWLPSAMYKGISFSPDGKYVMVSTVEKPFSYLVTYGRFPSKTVIYTKEGKAVETVLEVPLIEDLPQGFMATRKGRRNISWRADKASNLIYVEALDGGDPKNEVEHRDEVFELKAPFKGVGKSILKTINRFSGISWATPSMAIAYDYWWNTRNTKSYLFNPSDNKSKVEVLEDRNYQDRYSDPGNFVRKRNEYGSYVLNVKDGKVYLLGDGFTPEGQYPFLDEMDLKTKEKKRIYKSDVKGKRERLTSYDVEKNKLMVRMESPSEYPNYFFRDLNTKELKQLTSFENPFKSIQGVHKEVINYKRDDGLDLTGNTLFANWL